MKNNFFKQLIFVIFILFIGSINCQDNMIYYPYTLKPSQESLVPYRIKFWGIVSDDYRGYVSTVPVSGKKGTIIVFHGNAGAAADRAYYVNALSPIGYRVILAEYPGYGGRKGDPGETIIVKDAEETIRLTLEEFGKPVFLLGESLGCGVVAAAVKDWPVQINGIILITPWDTLISVAKEKAPILPVRLILKDRYDSINNLKTFTGRIAVAGAELDEVIPIHHAYTLYGTLPDNKKMWVIEGAGHNNWLDHVNQSWWKDIIKYIEGGDL